jgi:methionyl-tRNA formyltransferase
MTLRVGFAGTPRFATVALTAIAEAEFTIALVLTRPDKPKGRGLRTAASDVKQQALDRRIPVLQPTALRTPKDAAPLLEHPIDVLVVAAYGLILPQHVLDWPRAGCLNIHASRLPRWRGAAPIQRAIEAGDTSTGVTITQMDAGLDTGPVIEIREVNIDPRETAGTLHDKLAEAGGRAIVEVLRKLDLEGSLERTPQPAQGVTYAAKIGRDDARIDWTRDASTIDRQVRAFDPAPGAFTLHDKEPLKIWRAEPLAYDTAGGAPGTLVAVDEGIVVACGREALRIHEVQPAGGRRMAARAYSLGRSLRAGDRFQSQA